MNDPGQELLIGLVANGLAELISRALGGDEPAPFVKDAEAAVDRAIVELTDVEAFLPELGGEDFRVFLTSRETRTVIRQIYASEADAPTLDDIEREFIELWRIRTGAQPDKEASQAIKRVFSVLVRLCQHSLEQAIEDGSLTALEAENARRHNELRGAIEGVERILELIDGNSKLDSATIDEYADKYRLQLAKREGQITPPTLDAARPIPIDDLYVPARLTPLDGTSPHSHSFDEFAAHLFRAVVLGDPGSGKSTLAKKLAVDLARDRIDIDTGGRGVVPFLVVLRDFGSHKKEHPCSIADFIEIISNSRYQLPPPPGAIEYLLLTGRAVVIFDGLDELLDTSYRAEISGDVQSFASLYPSVPILVTSRDVGYQQAPLPETTFATHRLSEFSEEDVQTYAEKWFAVSEDDLPGSTQDQVATFMADSSKVADLRANALMLGLMCNLYKGSGYIPRNRPDVYEACAELLFDRWDRLRQIDRPINIESLLRPTMQHLAAWIYGDDDLQSGVTENRLIDEATNYLLGRRFDDPDDARLEASRFIEFCRGRAWVFTDIGTQPKGERLYQFTHRTFLEFFTAGHLVRTNATAESLLEILEPHIAAKEWDVVGQLAFQLLERNVDGAANDLLTALLPQAAVRNVNAQNNCLNFAIRSLEFLVPAPSVTRELVGAAISQFEDSAKRGEEAGIHTVSPPVTSILDFSGANPENAIPIQDGLIAGLDDCISNDLTACQAAELVMSFGAGRSGQRGEEDPLPSVRTALLERSGDRLIEISRSDVRIASDLVLAGYLPGDQFIADHGYRAAFMHRRYPLFPGRERVSIGELAVGALLWDTEGHLSQLDARSLISALVEPLSSTRPPWYVANTTAFGWLFRSPPEGWRGSGLTVQNLSPDERYVLVALLAAYLEEAVALRSFKATSAFVDGMPSLESGNDAAPIWELISPILQNRIQPEASEQGFVALKNLDLREDQEALLLGWMESDISLVDAREPPAPGL